VYRIANETSSNLRAIFANTASRRGISPAIIEKDFWVCFLLEVLFHQSKYAKHFAFKGGTSLSKVYKAIERFSEDIDLIVDWRLLGYSLTEPWESRSRTKQTSFNQEAALRTEQFLATEFIPHLEKSLSSFIKDFDLYLDPDDSQTVLFRYPQIFTDQSLLQEIRLEIGPLAAWSPSAEKPIIPYAAEEFPEVFRMPSTLITTVEAKRTFWEKATILYREANRKNGTLPLRYSRHYYDLHMLCNTPIKRDALEDIELLRKVAAFKDKFFHCAWAKYEEALPSTLRLVPSDNVVKKLREDFKNMKAMIFGAIPTFDQILATLKELEHEMRRISY